MINCINIYVSIYFLKLKLVLDLKIMIKLPYPIKKRLINLFIFKMKTQILFHNIITHFSYFELMGIVGSHHRHLSDPGTRSLEVL